MQIDSQLFQHQPDRQHHVSLASPAEIDPDKATIAKAELKWPLPSSPKIVAPPPQRETLVSGARECSFTTVKFTLTQANGDSEHDTLTINIDDRRGKSPSSVTIRGKWEAAEMPGQFRWLADAIAQHVENKGPAFREQVTSEKLRGGGA